jgi:hypothetical protein
VPATFVVCLQLQTCVPFAPAVQVVLAALHVAVVEYVPAAGQDAVAEATVAVKISML